MISSRKRQPWSNIAIFENPGDGQLLLVAQALGARRLRFGAGKGRQKQGGKDANDRNDDEQFDEGEPWDTRKPGGFFKVLPKFWLGRRIHKEFINPVDNKTA